MCMSQQVLPTTMGGKRLYYISFESVPQHQKRDFDPVSGVFAVSGATHPKLSAKRVAGGPPLKVTITKIQTSMWVLGGWRVHGPFTTGRTTPAFHPFVDSSSYC